MELMESYVYKKEVDWSLLKEGLTLANENQVIFGRNMGNFLSRGESKEITLYLNGKGYKAKIYNVNYAERHNRKVDTLQIRYTKDGELANVLKLVFSKSYKYITEMRLLRDSNDRSMIKLPDEYKEYLAIYTTGYDDSYLLEAIISDDMLALKDAMRFKSEHIMEASFNYNITDQSADVFKDLRMTKIRKLNKAIGDNLKLLYSYRCQICGESIGECYGSHVVEAHHIDYFVKSLNNDSKNQMVICPNHHSIIHDVNPIFDRQNMIYLYPNGTQEGLQLNIHLARC